jgi:uncharacterized protein (TIGR02001 family)
MKKTICGLTLLLLTATAQADWSANLGYMSEYHFRGILQKVSSVSGGIDYEAGGFYVGTWAADVGDGLEVDGYFGYGLDLGELSLSIGYTGYFYTGDFDDTYQEINLGAGFGPVSLDVAVGEYDNRTGPTLDYTFAALTLEHNGFYGTYGTFSDIDLGIALILANDDLIGDDDESLVFTIGKSFDL